MIGAQPRYGTHLGLATHRAHAAVYRPGAGKAETGDWGCLRVRQPLTRGGRGEAPKTADTPCSSIPTIAGAGVVDASGLGVLADELTSSRRGRRDPYRISHHRQRGRGTLYRDRCLDANLGETTTSISKDSTHPQRHRADRPGPAGPAACGAPITVLPCDNLQSNGHATRAGDRILHASSASEDVLARRADLRQLPEPMVDCIVPATTDETRTRWPSCSGWIIRSGAGRGLHHVVLVTRSAGRPVLERA